MPIKGRRKRRVNYEEDECINFIQWLSLAHPWLYDLTTHIPNGGKRGKLEAARFKLMGVKRGIPDYAIFFPSGPYHALFIEMKRPLDSGSSKPITSTHQKQWIEKLRQHNYVCYVCYSAEEASDVVKKYLSLK